MRRSTADELRIASRRSKVASYLLRGITNQFDICAKLGMEPGQRTTISRDIQAIKEDWKQSAVRDFDEAKGRELEKLDLLEATYWDAWERSRVERTSTRTRRRTRGEEAADEAEMKKEQRDGDPRFLDGVLSCIKKRCDILGLDAPTRHAVGGDPDAPPVKHDINITPEQLRELPISERIRLYREALAPPSGN